MTEKDRSKKPDSEDPFQLKAEDLEAMAQQQSQVVPEQHVFKTPARGPWTIENAPVAKSMSYDYAAEIGPADIARAQRAKELAEKRPEVTPWTIENAPVAKSIQRDMVAEMPSEEFLRAQGFLPPEDAADDTDDAQQES